MASLDEELCYRAFVARDARFDGWFLAGVVSTRIYCRASCPSAKPRRDRVRFFSTSAAAQRAGFRACRRCRPDVSPGSPEWDRRGDVVGRAMRSIREGVVDREGLGGLARRLGYSPRQIQRLLVAEVGAGPLDLARAQRAEVARVLLETTDLEIGEIVFAAGFGSVRQFNDTVRQVFGEPPRAMRERSGRGGCLRSAAGGARPRSVTLRLAYRSPFPIGVLFRFLATRAVAGLEEGDCSFYRRALRLPGGAAVVTLTDGGDGAVRCMLQLEDLRDLNLAVQRVKQLLDLDADPSAVTDLLSGDPVIGRAVRVLPGLRIAGHVDGAELAVRAVLGQQVSVAGARTLTERIVRRHGVALEAPVGSVRWMFPAPEVLAAMDPDTLAVPSSRAACVIRLAETLAAGELVLDRTADRQAVAARLLSLPGVGPWTVAYVQMRALGDPDAFMPSDLGVRRALERLGLPAGMREVTELSQQWRPYRAYALQYLWSGLLESPPSSDGRRHRPSRAHREKETVP